MDRTLTDVLCKELDQCQFELLSAISEDESRYQVYAMGWGDNDVSVKRRGIYIDLQDSDYKADCAPSKFFQSKEMSIDTISIDNSDASKLFTEMTIDQSRTHSSTFELSKNSMVFEEVKAGALKHKERKIAAQRDSQYYIEKFEQECKHRMAAEEKIKQLQIENEYLKSREMDIKQKNEILLAQLHQLEENDQLKQELSDSQKAIVQFKDTIEDLTQYGEVYQKELQDLQAKIDRMKEEFDQIEQECNQVKQECDQMKQERDQMKQECDHVTQEYDQMKQERDQMKQECDQVKQECDQVKQEHDHVKQEHDQIKQEHDHVKQECDQMKQEYDHCMAENALLENQVEALGAIKEQFSSLLPTYQWKIDHDELIITANVLGTGAWGFVKEGTFHGTKVAVKCIHQAIISIADEAIQREFDVMAQVRHPNLVLLIGIVFNDPRHKCPLIITELLDCDMRSAYKEGKLDRPCRLPLLRDVAAALNYLHSRKQPIIHRDISSANVMLEASGNGKWKRAKLCDFGSAKLTSRASTPAPGAAIYSAPETLPATKGKQTVKVDVYSFGVLYTEILLARLPPDLDPTADDLLKYISDLKQLEGPGEDLHHTAHICTNKNPKKRPTMQDVLHDIDQHIIIASTAT